MPPKKDKSSKKAEQKKKTQSIEDRTFGLKNKNKSKKVQTFVQSVTTSVMNSGDRKQRQLEEQRKQQRAEQKARKKAMEEEQNALFNEALGALNKKSTNLKEGKTEAKGRDADEEGATKKGTSRAMKMMFQMDGKLGSIRVENLIVVLMFPESFSNVRLDRDFPHCYLLQRWPHHFSRFSFLQPRKWKSD